ncbi:hypothetical protein HDU97_007226, partial [Phlyctochytrium planicorne]
LPDGRVPETTDWPAGVGNAVSQMPTIPYALLAIYRKTGDVSFLQEQLPNVARYLDWWRTTRDLGDGLKVTVHPWESGIDASPAYDAAWHFTPAATEELSWLFLYPKFPELRDYYKNTWKDDYSAVLKREKAESSLLANWFVVQDVAINTLIAAGWGVLGDLASLYDSEAAAVYYAHNAEHEAVIKARMWSKDLQRFITPYKDQDGSMQASSVQAIQSLFPLLLRSLTTEQRDALIADTTNPNKFWTNYPFPSVSKSEPTYTPKYRINLLWRGPSWGLTNWFVVEGLINQNRTDLASVAVDRWVSALKVSGVWEMWNPDTGMGYGAEGLGMSNTFIELLHRLNKINPANDYAGNGITVADLWSSGQRGSASGGDPYDDSFWVLALGKYATIDRIDLAGGGRVDKIGFLYGDSRSNENFYVAHGTPGTSATTSINIPRGVNISSATSCIGQYGGGRRVFFVQFDLTNGQSIQIGKRTSDCVTYTPPAGMRIIGTVGRAGTANDNIGFYGYY